MDCLLLLLIDEGLYWLMEQMFVEDAESKRYPVTGANKSWRRNALTFFSNFSEALRKRT